MHIKSLPPFPLETDTIPLAVIVLFKALCICKHMSTIILIGIGLIVFVFLVFQGVFPILSLDATGRERLIRTLLIRSST